MSDSNPLSILIVEDDIATLEMLERRIRRSGNHPITADTLALAQTSMHEHVDVAILDVRIGDERVFSIAEQMAKKGVPFIFCSASDDLLGTQFKDVPIVHKPASPDTIIQTALSRLRAYKTA